MKIFKSKKQKRNQGVCEMSLIPNYFMSLQVGGWIQSCVHHIMTDLNLPYYTKITTHVINANCSPRVN